jgi:hypothetical protein
MNETLRTANTAGRDIDYEPLQHSPIAKRLLVIGAPRSGTHFIAAFLQEFGMRVKHERMGEDGTVNFAWLAMRVRNDPIVKVTGRQNYDFDQMMHIVRHPLMCIPSISANLPRHFWDWQEIHSDLHIPDEDDLEMVAAFWIFWTDGCQHLCDKTLRLEDLAHMGKPEGLGVQRNKDPITLDDCGAMAEEVEKRMKLYGYGDGTETN